MDFKQEDFIQLDAKDFETKYRVVFVKNLPKVLIEQDYKKYFSQFGEVLSLSVIEDGKGRSTGKIYVEFKDPDVAQICFDKINNQILDGQILRANLYEKYTKQHSRVQQRITSDKLRLTALRVYRTQVARNRLKTLLEKYSLKYSLI
ncbi:hypothetical protein EIN_468240 [Entamoeba invadens IP1]|uniref:RRM domain-containing protein n=1 Tax=Entamoeba invadens IP1 TaxID=370355 RepID=A0A0A1TUH9_ENTIV|nr:hypothetical protein EIN_468240 [Entamoeba invadens IP1]ELP83690.1 hypothetical protein EIN_468240 [Entamoeba invadens IP1]|eukprot:XP_004183036.1 hypothetical protein EIN_468240 [Entamoeba invadens IP1]